MRDYGYSVHDGGLVFRDPNGVVLFSIEVTFEFVANPVFNVYDGKGECLQKLVTWGETRSFCDGLLVGGIGG